MSHAVIPHIVISCADLTHTDIVVYGALSMHLDTGAECRISNEDIASTCNCSKTKVAKSIKTLESEGFIHVYEDGKGRVIVFNI